MREQLRGQGFHFFCFSTEKARAEFSLRKLPEEYACVEVNETLAHRFPVYFLAVQKLHHTPVRYTPPLERV